MPHVWAQWSCFLNVLCILSLIELVSCQEAGDHVLALRGRWNWILGHIEIRTEGGKRIFQAFF